MILLHSGLRDYYSIFGFTWLSADTDNEYVLN